MSHKFYTINAKANRSADILIYGDIGDSWFGESVTAKDFVKEIAALDVDTINVRINSAGGSVTDGIAIHNSIKRHPAKIDTFNDGEASSIASLIMQSGGNRFMAANAIMMVHAPFGGAPMNAPEHREFADILDVYSAAMATTYAAATGKTEQEILDEYLNGADHFFTAEEALAHGFIDAITNSLAMAASHDRAAISAHMKSFPLKTQTQTAAAAAQQSQEITMPEMDINAAAQANAAATDLAVKAAVQAAAQAETTRRADIKALAIGNLASNQDVQAILAKAADSNVTVDEARAQVLAALSKDAAPIAGSYVSVTDNSSDIRAASTTALMARAAVRGADSKVIVADRSNPFRGMSMMDMAHDSLARAGVNTKGMDKRAVVSAAFTQSTSDFPILLESVLHKTLQAAYATAPDTWSRFCKIGSVSDFRAHPRYRVGSLGNLSTVLENDEYDTQGIPDGEKSSITALTKGNIINVSRQMIINDDLDAFIGLAAAQGRAARRTIEAMVYALLAENGGLGPLLADGLTLFHATHGNIGTGAAISMTSIDADRVKMASQKDVGGNDFLDLRPSSLLLPIGLGGAARTINDAQYDPDTANKLQRPNMVRGLFRDVVDTPRLSGTRQYMFADPMEAPVIEVAFLDGVQEPFLESEQGFTSDGTLFKVRLDVAVGAIDYRGAVTNAGV